MQTVISSTKPTKRGRVSPGAWLLTPDRLDRYDLPNDDSTFEIHLTRNSDPSSSPPSGRVPFHRIAPPPEVRVANRLVPVRCTALAISIQLTTALFDRAQLTHPSLRAVVLLAPDFTGCRVDLYVRPSFSFLALSD